MRRDNVVLRVSLALLFAFAACSTFPAARAADHRDAPAINGAGEGDIGDVFAFRDPNDPSRIVIAMGVNPFSIPGVSSGYRFSPDYLYQFKIDIDGDYREDFVIQFRFEDTPTGQIVHEAHGVPIAGYIGAVNRAIPDQFGLVGPVGTVLGNSNETQVWCGQADDPFVVDLGQFNRIVQDRTQDVFRDIPDSPVGPLRGRPRRADGTSGADMLAGLNGSFLAVSFPASFVRGSRPIINVWGTVSSPFSEGGSYVQFERAGQPLFNTVFIPGPLKDAFNLSVPSEDVARWSSFVPDALTTTDTDGKNNTIAGRHGLLTVLGVHQPPFGAPLLLPANFVNTNRDLLRVALVPDVLRLNLDLAPNDLAIGQFGLINGRRYGDDTVDIAMRVLRQLADINFPAALGVPGSGSVRSGALTFGDPRITAVLQGTDFTKPDDQLGDLTTSGNDRPFQTEFPYLATPHPRTTER